MIAENPMASPEDEVRTASAHFYAALNKMANGDDSAMVACWSQGPTVTTQHPVAGRQVGWDQVRESFHQFSLVAADGQIRMDEQMIQVVGDLAYELGVERGSLRLGGQAVLIDSRATNIYRWEAHHWKLVHHHSDFSPAMMAALEKLMSKATAAR
jgi:ketosteroid isomerase-like protein